MAPFEGVPSRADYKSGEREFHQAGGELDYEVEAQAQASIDQITAQINALRKEVSGHPEKLDEIDLKIDRLINERTAFQSALKGGEKKTIN